MQMKNRLFWQILISVIIFVVLVIALLFVAHTRKVKATNDISLPGMDILQGEKIDFYEKRPFLLGNREIYFEGELSEESFFKLIDSQKYVSYSAVYSEKYPDFQISSELIDNLIMNKIDIAEVKELDDFVIQMEHKERRFSLKFYLFLKNKRIEGTMKIYSTLR